jgi:hypothetical protein
MPSPLERERADYAHPPFPSKRESTTAERGFVGDNLLRRALGIRQDSVETVGDLVGRARGARRMQRCRGGSDADEGAGERPAKLKRCESGETEQVGESEDAGAPGTASQGFGGIELRTNGDVVGFVEDEQCRVRVGYVETPQDLEELEKGLSKRAYDQEIPLSNFDMISDTQRFFLNNAGNPYGGDYTAKLLVREVDSLQEGGEGENAPPYATVELRSYREGRITSKAIFRDFPAPLGARLQLTFPAALTRNAREADPKNLRLLIDENADLSADEARPPSSVVAGPAAGGRTRPGPAPRSARDQPRTRRSLSSPQTIRSPGGQGRKRALGCTRSSTP